MESNKNNQEIEYLLLQVRLFAKNSLIAVSLVQPDLEENHVDIFSCKHIAIIQRAKLSCNMSKQTGGKPVYHYVL